MFGLEIIDIVVIIIYFAAMIYIGLRAMMHIRNQEDYFLGGRRFGKVVQTFAAFGQGTSADTAVGTTTTTYNNGASGIWSALLYLWTTPVYWFTSPWYRRMRVLTLGDYFEERFGSKKMAGFFSIIASIVLMGFIAIGMKAVSVTVLGITQKSVSELSVTELEEYNMALELDRLRQIKAEKNLSSQQYQRFEVLEVQNPRKDFSHINESLLIWIICVIVFVYAVAGGLEAAFYTDMIQGMFIIVLSIIMIPFGLARINTQFGSTGLLGAIKTIHTQLPEWYFDIFGAAQTLDFTWYYIAAVSMLVAVNVAVQANQMNAIGSAKDELTARIGFTSGCFMKRFCTVLWGMSGLIAIVLYAGKIENSDYVWGYATRDLFGSLGMGLVGLMIACLLAALMSTADMMMITASGVLTHNLYRPLFPNFSESHYVGAGRIAGAVVLILAVLLATWFDSILQMLKFIWEFNAILAAAFWCGIKWRRANRIGAWSSMIVTMLLFVIIPTLLTTVLPSLRQNNYLLKQSDPAPIIRTYSARQMDINKREQEIQYWDTLKTEHRTRGNRPEKLVIGQKITKIIQPPQRAFFWSKGIKDRNGQPYGDGILYIEMVIVDKIYDLSKVPYALSETIRTLIKILLPFLVLIVVSLLTKPDDRKKLDRFFVKMRTPVMADKKTDEIEMQKSYANPERFKEDLLFPNSSFEFLKWGKIDAAGFGIAVLVLLGIIGMLWLLLNIGS